MAFKIQLDPKATPIDIYDFYVGDTPIDVLYLKLGSTAVNASQAYWARAFPKNIFLHNNVYLYNPDGQKIGTNVLDNLANYAYKGSDTERANYLFAGDAWSYNRAISALKQTSTTRNQANYTTYWITPSQSNGIYYIEGKNITNRNSNLNSTLANLPKLSWHDLKQMEVQINIAEPSIVTGRDLQSRLRDYSVFQYRLTFPTSVYGDAWEIWMGFETNYFDISTQTIKHNDTAFLANTNKPNEQQTVRYNGSGNLETSTIDRNWLLTVTPYVKQVSKNYTVRKSDRPVDSIIYDIDNRFRFNRLHVSRSQQSIDIQLGTGLARGTIERVRGDISKFFKIHPMPSDHQTITVGGTATFDAYPLDVLQGFWEFQPGYQASKYSSPTRIEITPESPQKVNIIGDPIRYQANIRVHPYIEKWEVEMTPGVIGTSYGETADTKSDYRGGGSTVESVIPWYNLYYQDQLKVIYSSVSNVFHHFKAVTKDLTVTQSSPIQEVLVDAEPSKVPVKFINGDLQTHYLKIWTYDPTRTEVVNETNTWPLNAKPNNRIPLRSQQKIECLMTYWTAWQVDDSNICHRWSSSEAFTGDTVSISLGSQPFQTKLICGTGTKGFKIKNEVYTYKPWSLITFYTSAGTNFEVTTIPEQGYEAVRYDVTRGSTQTLSSLTRPAYYQREDTQPDIRFSRATGQFYDYTQRYWQVWGRTNNQHGVGTLTYHVLNTDGTSNKTIFNIEDDLRIAIPCNIVGRRELTHINSTVPEKVRVELKLIITDSKDLAFQQEMHASWTIDKITIATVPLEPL